jgi:hypothetical protein
MSVGNSGFFKKFIESGHGFQHALMLAHFGPHGILTSGAHTLVSPSQLKQVRNWCRPKAVFIRPQ